MAMNSVTKKVLITGVTGMDGSLMADFLLKNTKHTIIAGVRRLSVKNHENINHLLDNPRFKLIDLDITDSSNVENVIREEAPDYFINFAANSFVGNSWTMPVNHMNTNCMAVLYQLEAIRKFVPKCRYYNAGSSEEWGDVAYTPQDEKHPARPRSPYGASKVAARQLVKVWRESYGLYAIQGWLLNHEGVRRGKEFVTRKITTNVARIKKSLDLDSYGFEPLELGNLDAKRDWSDAEDFVDGVWRMLNQDHFNKEIAGWCMPLTHPSREQFLSGRVKEYVLSSNETHSVREFVEKAFAAAGIKGIWWNFSSHPQDEEFLLADKNHPTLATKRKVTLVRINKDFYRPAEVDLLWGNSDLARKELGWKPETSFEDLVKKMIDSDIKLSKVRHG